MAILRSLCLYCGSRIGAGDAHRAAAAELGTLLGQRGGRLVFGGGRNGLMGVAADAALAAGGQVIGVIPDHLHDFEAAHDGLSELIVVDSMHARKQKMFELADAFAVLPGGLGTLDETIEIITWRQLGLHDKPIVVLDNSGYWQPLLDLVEHAIDAGFAGPSARDLFTVVDSVAGIFAAIEAAPESRPGAPPELL
jgi:uncharacterized protein (TIGR00730 family)